MYKNCEYYPAFLIFYLTFINTNCVSLIYGPPCHATWLMCDMALKPCAMGDFGFMVSCYVNLNLFDLFNFVRSIQLCNYNAIAFSVLIVVIVFLFFLFNVFVIYLLDQSC